MMAKRKPLKGKQATARTIAQAGRLRPTSSPRPQPGTEQWWERMRNMAEEIKAQTGRLLRSPLLVRLAGDSFRRVLEDHDWLRNVTLMDCYLLMLIEHNGPLDSSQVMHCDPGLVPSTPDARVALDSLTRRGFLQPQPKNRRRAYHLTSAGEMVTRMLVAEGRWGLGESSSYGQEIQRLRKERRKLMEGRARGG